jgi:hypothetical protein
MRVFSFLRIFIVKRTETMDKEFDKFLKSKDLEKKVADIVKKETKTEAELEDFVVDVTKNVLTQLYKTFWTKRNFWKSSLKNKAN